MASVKARYLAEAGIARAIAELKYGPDGPLYNAVDTTSEAWYGADPYSKTGIDLGNGWTGKYTVTSIVDCASRINISDGNPNLATMLRTLNGQIGSPLDDPDDIDAIANNAPYETKKQILSILTGTQDERETKYNAIKAYITVFSYIDPNTINPKDIIDPPYESQPRAPINVNTASREVLIAVLSGIKADHACPNCGGDGHILNNATDCSACNGTGKLEITSTEAGNLADYIIANRPYRTWGEFYSSIKSCSDIGEKDADLVMANCNPNTGFSWARNVGWREKLGSIGKYVIDFDRDGDVDSNDKGLTGYTTEFSFNSGGYYRVKVNAQVKDAFGNIVAKKDITAVVKIFDIHRDTTQAQFDAGTKTNIQSYPEPVQAGIASANYDGQLMLAKKRRNTPNSGTHLLANFLSGVGLDSASGSKDLLDIPAGKGTKPNINSVASSSNRGDLLPDGLLVEGFLEKDRPVFDPVNNISADEGTMEIWFKPLYPGNDTMVYGDSDGDKKMFRLTSYPHVSDYYSESSACPYVTFFFWSDTGGYTGLHAMIKWGGGGWSDSDGDWRFGEASQAYGRWYGCPSGGPDPNDCWGGPGIDYFNAGEWNHLAISWKYTLNEDGEGGEGKMYFYYNGNLMLDGNYWGCGHYNFNDYLWHTSYGSSDLEFGFMLGHEYSQWWGYSPEFSNSIIGLVRIWDSQLSQSAIQANYNDGIYVGPAETKEFISSTFSLPQNVEWGTITWTEAIPDDITVARIVFNVDTGSGFGTDNWFDSSGDNQIKATSKSIQYKATFVVFTPGGQLIDTPVLEDVTISYMGPTEIKYWREH